MPSFDIPAIKYFKVLDHDGVVKGLDRITLDHDIFRMLSLNKDPDTLEVNQSAVGWDRSGQHYEVVRTA